MCTHNKYVMRTFQINVRVIVYICFQEMNFKKKITRIEIIIILIGWRLLASGRGW